LKRTFGSGVDVELVAGTNGVYEVTADNVLIFSKRQLGRFPDEGEIVRLLQNR
jgi:selenoprotein W-related protein